MSAASPFNGLVRHGVMLFGWLPPEPEVSSNTGFSMGWQYMVRNVSFPMLVFRVTDVNREFLEDTITGRVRFRK